MWYGVTTETVKSEGMLKYTAVVRYGKRHSTMRFHHLDDLHRRGAVKVWETFRVFRLLPSGGDAFKLDREG